MDSKQHILEAIKKNKPAETLLPDLLSFPATDNLTEKYTQSLSLNGGSAIGINTLEDIHTYLKENFPEDLLVASLVEGIEGNMDAQDISDPHDLETVEVVLVSGEVGVAENAAIWISEKSLPHRVLPFIAQHLIIVLEEDQLVTNMHEAYQKINVAEGGYGVFIAGPSKTADIEQSLVIGAHGARSLTVFLVKN
ncbi:MAG: LUD domain-containing protein [Anditalea sp.]